MANYLLTLTRPQQTQARAALDAFGLIMYDCNKRFPQGGDACFAERAQAHANRTCHLYAQRLAALRARITDVVTLNDAELLLLTQAVCGLELIGWPGMGDDKLRFALVKAQAQTPACPHAEYGAALQA